MSKYSTLKENTIGGYYMRFSFSIKLIGIEFELQYKWLKCKSRGNIITWLGLIGGFAANLLGYANFNPWLIVGASICAGFVLDVFIFGIFLIKLLVYHFAGLFKEDASKE